VIGLAQNLFIAKPLHASFVIQINVSAARPGLKQVAFEAARVPVSLPSITGPHLSRLAFV